MKTSLMFYAGMAVLIFACTGCYEIVYNVEWKGDSCIKFEDAQYWDEELLPEPGYVEDCLGEDGAVEADLFYADLDDDAAPEDIDVTIKAGKCKETIEGLVWDDDYEAYTGQVCGFMVLGEPDIDGWTFAVVSDDVGGGKDGTAALSNVTFCFGDGVMVTGPVEGDFSTYRADEEEIDEFLGDGD